ncbi:MAG: GNAT family N-acetyltransferase [Clostridia bacterium]|nr:GNAT family N-acetyltransferase [Clostridia bacterium]
MEYLYNKDGYTIRFATRADVPAVLGFICELADYEHMSECVVTDVPTLEASLFDRNKAEVLMAELEGKPIGYALFFHSFSTFLGREGIYLEDLYITPTARGKGYGKRLLANLAKLAVERRCGRLEWACLDWNKPSIDFYLSLDAEPQSEWTTYRLTGDTLTALASKA